MSPVNLAQFYLNLFCTLNKDSYYIYSVMTLDPQKTLDPSIKKKKKFRRFLQLIYTFLLSIWQMVSFLFCLLILFLIASQTDCINLFTCLMKMNNNLNYIFYIFLITSNLHKIPQSNFVVQRQSKKDQNKECESLILLLKNERNSFYVFYQILLEKKLKNNLCKVTSLIQKRKQKYIKINYC